MNSDTGVKVKYKAYAENQKVHLRGLENMVSQGWW